MRMFLVQKKGKVAALVSRQNDNGKGDGVGLQLGRLGPGSDRVSGHFLMWLKNTISFSSANLLGQFMRVIQELVTRQVLAPATMGLWNYILVVRNFGSSLDLGITAALLRKLALLHGAQKPKEIGTYRKTALILYLSQQALIGLAIVVYALFINRGTKFFWPTITGAVMLFLGGFGEILETFYIGAAKYSELSRRLLAYWPIYTILLVVGVYVAQIPGLVIGMFCALIIRAFILRFGTKVRFSPVEHRWTNSAAKSLLAVGVPFRLVDYPMALHQMLDVLFIVNFLGIEFLAIYSTAKVIFQQAGQLPAWFGSVIVIRLTQEVGANQKSRKELGNIVFSYLRFYYLVIVPTLICVVSGAAVIVFTELIPKYKDAMGPLLILLFILYFAPYATIIGRFWLIDKRFGALLLSNMVALISLVIGLIILLVIHVLTPVSVTIVFLLSHTIYFVFLLGSLGPELWDKGKLAAIVIFVIVSMGVTLLALKAGGLLAWKAFTPNFAAVASACLKEMAILTPMILYGLLPAVTPILARLRTKHKNP